MSRVAVLESGPHRRRRWAFPHHVVGETADGVNLFIRAGTVGVAVRSKEAFWGDGPLGSFTWHSYDVLRCTPASSWHSVELFFQPDGTFAGWYVNFQTPLERTETGYRMCDLELDIWVEPDRSWEWKDREAFEQLVDERHISQVQRASVERDADEVVRRISRGQPPFDDAPPSWRPDPSLVALVLADWEAEPPL